VAYVAGQSVMDDARVQEETSWRHSRDS
jgi:hypothetical protein